ncbi:SDR family oxidoreductase [Sporosarcina sp. FA9]|uniref:SDR family oxidoreductase n=1 Tax=Sporosarcina sp. FA9 TaxID=3413030 RepID=UPI003F6556FD
MKVHFLTGFPGFITTELIKELIKEGNSNLFYALVLPEQVDFAKRKADSMLKELNSTHSIKIVAGDITKPNLGMNEVVLQELYEKTLTVWHLAAIYDLAVKEELAWKVNVEGTIVVNKFVRSHPDILRYMYFSTAYVAGKREGKLLETELIRPTSFKNYYEETKFEAELLVEELKDLVAITIIRPGIARGHSKTGETIKFDGPYFFMNMIDRLKWLPIIPYVGKSEAFLNVVPIDYIISASVYLSSHSAAESQTIHLTDPTPHPVEEIYRAMVFEVTGKNPKGRFPKVLAAKALTSKRIQQMLGVEAETLDYLTWNAMFDTTIADRLLEESEIHCADFIKSIPAMTVFYNQNKNNADFHIKIV